MKKAFLIIGLIVALLVIIKLFNKNNIFAPKQPGKPKQPIKKMNKEQFDKDLAAFLLIQEGGLSNDPTDTAAKSPSPTPEKWHTNKGVTWPVFVDSSRVLKYNPTPQLFINMPDSIPLAIFRMKYYKLAEKLSNSELLNTYLALWFWGGWDKDLMPASRVTAVLLSNKTEAQKLTDLVNLRKEYFNNIVKANPKQKRFLKGWLNRADIFLRDFTKYANN